MNVQEKSDCAVVPVNQPNNEGQQPSAEAGEGRARTEENIVPSYMRPTQSGKRMSQGLHSPPAQIRTGAFTPTALTGDEWRRNVLLAAHLSNGRPYRDSNPVPARRR
jgi:hypothetical protein